MWRWSPRKARRARRNQGYGLGTHGIVVFPINRLSLRWAADFYAVKADVERYRKIMLDELLPIMNEVQPGSAAALLAGGQLNEEKLLNTLVTMRKGDARLKAVADKVWPSIGLEEEWKKLNPPPRYGLLSGDGIVDAGFQLTAPMFVLVQTLDKATELSRAGAGYPCVAVGTAVGGAVAGLMVTVGAADQLHGMALLPIAYNPSEVARTAAGIVLAMLQRGFWNGAGWSPQARLMFALPQRFDVEGLDATHGGEFGSMVCPRHVRYVGEGVSLTLGFSQNEQAVAGVLAWGSTRGPVQDVEVADLVRGSLDPRQGLYVISIGRGAGGTVERVGANQVRLTLPDRTVELQQAGDSRICPGPGMPGAGILAPQVIRWLQSGALLLAQEGQDRRALAGMVEQMGALPMGFVGTLPASGAADDPRVYRDGVPRYLPAESSTGPSFYGSPPQERALVSARLSKRILLSGWRMEDPKKPAPPLMTFLQMAHRSDTKFVVNKEAIAALRGDLYSLAQLRGLEVKAAGKLESALWKEGTPEAVIRAVPSIPIVGPDSPVCTIVLTLWGVSEHGAPVREYRPLWQSPPIEAQHLNQVVGAYLQRYGETAEAEDPETGEPVEMHFKPALALRAWAAEQSGLLNVAMQYEAAGQPPAAFALVGAAVVDVQKLGMLADGPWPKPLLVGKTMCLGRQVEAGLCLFKFDIPGVKKRPRVPDVQQLLAVHGDALPGLVPARQPYGDLWSLAQGVTWVGWDRSNRHILPLLGTTWTPTNLFSFQVLSQTEAFRRNKKKLEGKQEEAEGEKKLSPEEIVRKTYYTTIDGGVWDFFGRPAGMDVVVGGRRAFTAMGGAKAAGVRKGTTEGSPGRMQSPDPGFRQFATQGRKFYRNIFGFAASVCKETGACTREGARRTQVGIKEAWREAIESTRHRPDEPSMVIDKLQEYGIPVPDDLTDPAALRSALVQLRDAMHVAYAHKVSTGLLPQQLTRQGDEFSAEYVDEMSRLNPLREGDVEKVVEYGKSRKRVKEPGELPAIFTGLTEPEKWPITAESVQALFPREYEGRGTWSPEKRLPKLSSFDIVSRLAALPPELVGAGREKVIDPEARRRAVDPERPEMPFADEQVRALMTGAAGLSVDDAVAILHTQRGSQRISQTTKGMRHAAIQPSSAVCKLFRKVKLRFYTPPPQVFTAGDPRTHKVLLLMSPAHLREARVMTFRRGAHIDCDMVGPPEMLPELLGRAIQSTLLWLVERGGRVPGKDEKTSHRNRLAWTDVYVGRVGTPFLYLAHRAGEALSVAQVTANLQRGQAGDPLFQIPLYKEGLAVALRRDIENYESAVQSQFGESRLAPMPAEYRAAQTPARPAPAEVIPAEVAEEEGLTMARQFIED